MPETFRAFIAYDLPESVRSSLAAVQQALKLYGFRVRWVRPANIHLTLKFLGSTAEADTSKIAGAMSQAVKDCESISLVAKGIGVFPDSRRPRVIWAGLAGQLVHLQKLQHTLDDYLAELGFAKETRAFKAHLTLGRVKGKIASARIKTAIEKLDGFASESFEVNQIILFKSELRPSGAVYSKVHRVTF